MGCMFSVKVCVPEINAEQLAICNRCTWAALPFCKCSDAEIITIIIIIIIIIIYNIYRALIPNGPKALYIIKITTKS